MEERIFLVPPAGKAFDLDELRGQLAANRCTVRHPRFETESYIVSPHPNTAKMVAEELSRNPNAGAGGSALVELSPQCITGFFEYADRDALAQVAALLLPILRSQEVQLINLYGQDVTEKYKGRLEWLFG